uniref:Pectinesterase inhibitor domain-containing protein n=1 Tax=Aegilops tauschii subsp. strangulata TaxID=200361 RepID=A0A453DX78_AEGTS
QYATIMAVGTSSSMLGGAFLLLVLSSATDVHGGPSSSAAPRSPLDYLCNNLGPAYVGANLCVSTLCIDPSCRSTRGLPGLAVIATRLTVSNATVAKASIEHALAHAKDDKARKAMRSCLQLYTGAIPRLQWAARSAAAGRYSGVPEVLLAARYVSDKCTNLAGEGALPKENVEFFMMAFVAEAVVEGVQLFIG